MLEVREIEQKIASQIWEYRLRGQSFFLERAKGILTAVRSVSQSYSVCVYVL